MTLEIWKLVECKHIWHIMDSGTCCPTKISQIGMTRSYSPHRQPSLYLSGLIAMIVSHCFGHFIHGHCSCGSLKQGLLVIVGNEMKWSATK